jgi:hypothetical protein
MESKKINQLATELAPDLSDLTIIGDPTTGISKKITLSQMASLFTGTVEEYANLAAFPLVGVADTIYIAKDTNVIYRWDSTAYVVLSPNVIASLVFNDANGFDGNIALVGSTATLTITTALTSGSVPFIGASGALTQDNANLFFDDTNNRLGINTNAPTTALDVFGSGIIGRINGTSTNNAYLGFSSAGTNKWSVGNVQSDHRFRIFSEANTSELVSVLQTGEFGIGIANPTTKFHIDGAASALIANLDANVSVAKSLSFRSDNSNRINLEVSGTESGSNVGADFFLRTFTDAGSLIETPLSIVRSTGVTTIKSLTLTNALSVANGGTGSATQNFVDLTTTQTIAGLKTFSSEVSASSGLITLSGNAGLAPTGMVGLRYVANRLLIYGGSTDITFQKNSNSGPNLTILESGAATFTGEVNVTSGLLSISGSGGTTPSSGVGLRFVANRLLIYGGTQDITFQKNSNASANMQILESGNILMSAADSGYRLNVNGTQGAIIQGGSNSGNYALAIQNQAATVNYLLVRGDGQVNVGPYTYANAVGTPRTVYIDSAGVLGGISSILASKTNIKQFSTNWLYDLKPIQFNYRKKDENEHYTDEFDNELYYGLIAEETELVNKEICTYNEDKLIGIEYSKLVPVLLKAIQEQQAQIDELKAKIK